MVDKWFNLGYTGSINNKERHKTMIGTITVNIWTTREVVEGVAKIVGTTPARLYPDSAIKTITVDVYISDKGVTATHPNTQCIYACYFSKED